ncbi:MAG: PIG-L family deacetylase [Candidatus Levybacteria bacterium]|nr:PIG-L family deacetylase [Candidatus Levybacteria bacterium]
MKVLCVFAHPDDESFSSGGAIAKLTKEGHKVLLITATKGEAGQTGGLTTQETLGVVREKELQKAAHILGISEIFFLGYIDGTLEKIPVKEISKKILKIFLKEKPDIVITFNKEGGSRHPDHIQIHKGVTLAFKEYIKNLTKRASLYYADIPKSLLKKLKRLGTLYTAFGEIEGTDDTKITTVVDISETINTKIQAFMCHQTQKKDWERFLKRKYLPEFKKEYFTLARISPSAVDISPLGK